MNIFAASPLGRFSKATLQNCLRPLGADLHKDRHTYRAGLKLSSVCSARRALKKKEANEQRRRCNAFVLVCAPPMNGQREIARRAPAAPCV